MALGINEQNEFIQNLLGDLAYADFYHDFGDLKFKTAELFKEVSKILKTTESEIKLKEVMDYVNNNIKDTNIKTVYEYFKQTDLLTPATEKLDDNYLKEDKILDTILGNNIYKDIKERLKTNEENYFKGASLLKDVNMPIDIEGEIRRNYKYSVYPTKKDDKYYNLPYSYREVSNNNNFILLIDSSFFSFSSLRDENNILKITDRIGTEELSSNDINRSYTFYIIKNSENFADPATKISLFNKGNQRIKIKILKDKINTNIKFPAYSDESNEQNNNLFSSININTTNVKVEINKEEKINAEVNYPNKPSKKYDDISSLSDINNATLNALIESYRLRYNPLRKENNDEDKKLKSLIYLLLKRSGDWSQALSLLDRDRNYEIYDYDTGKNEGETTLNELKMKEKADIALVTHDRILLAYSILLGLNVFYSLKTKETKDDKGSIIWNVYFKNNDDTIEVNKSIYNKLSSNYPDYERRIEEYIKIADEIYEKANNNLYDIRLKPIPDNIIYDITSGKPVYKLIFTTNKYKKGSQPLRKEYEQVEPKSYILFFQDFIVKLRKQLIIVANLTSSQTIRKKSDEVKKIYAQINPRRNELYNNLNETYLNIEELHTINTKLDEIYTKEEEENDKNVIKTYFEIININGESEIKKKGIDDYFILLDKIHKNYITFQKILTKKELFFEIIPTIDELICNNIYIGNNSIYAFIIEKINYKTNKKNICKFLKEVRNQVTPDNDDKYSKDQDVIDHPSGKKKVSCDYIEFRKNLEGPQDPTNYSAKAKKLVNDLYHKGLIKEKKFYEVQLYLDLSRDELESYKEVEPPQRLTIRGNPNIREDLNSDNEESMNPQEEETQLVSGVNTNSNNNSPPTKKHKMEGGYIIEYIYDGNGSFFSTISVEEKDQIKKSILFYLDSLYSRLFSLKQYSNGGDDKDYPSFDDNVYEQYLIIYKELKSIALFLETNDSKEIIEVYNKKRYEWKEEDLKPYKRELNGGLNEVDDKLHKYYEELHERVSTATVTRPTVTRPKVTRRIVGIPTATGTPSKKKRSRNNRNNLNTNNYRTNTTTPRSMQQKQAITHKSKKPEHQTRHKRGTNPKYQTRSNHRTNLKHYTINNRKRNPKNFTRSVRQAYVRGW